MSVYPIYMNYERPRTPRHLLDQHFGLGLTPDDVLTVIAVPTQQRDSYRPWRNLQSIARDTGSTIKEDKDTFHINLDVQHFAPEEINVKIADGFVIVEAKHEEKQDHHGYVSRSFVRRYKLPEGVDEHLVKSKLSSDGVLSITAPLKAPPKGFNERIVPIVHTGPVKQVENSDVENKGD